MKTATVVLFATVALVVLFSFTTAEPEPEPEPAKSEVNREKKLLRPGARSAARGVAPKSADDKPALKSNKNGKKPNRVGKSNKVGKSSNGGKANNGGIPVKADKVDKNTANAAAPAPKAADAPAS